MTSFRRKSSQQRAKEQADVFAAVANAWKQKALQSDDDESKTKALSAYLIYKNFAEHNNVEVEETEQ